jgi:uncharacterized protein (TIGR02646 family)
MIKLTRPAKPTELDAETQKKLTDQFKADKKKTVWKQDWITGPLLKMSYNKCAFSEMMLMEEGKYMQVEHFHPKSKYPDEVVEWNNLLPICNFCNTAKGEYDTVRNPLVDPTVDNPKNFFYIKRGRLWPKGTGKTKKKAQLTIEQYKLNDYQQLAKVRRDLERDIEGRLADIRQLIDVDSKFNYARNRLRNLLKRCNRESSYSAVRCTFVLASEDYSYIKAKITEHNAWSAAFQGYEQEMLFCALPA